jgi:hypothetical protein
MVGKYPGGPIEADSIPPNLTVNSLKFHENVRQPVNQKNGREEARKKPKIDYSAIERDGIFLNQSHKQLIIR